MSQRDSHIHELFSAYLDGQTTPDESARVEQLLEGQHQHRELLDELRTLSVELQGLDRYRLEEGFAERVLERQKRKFAR